MVENKFLIIGYFITILIEDPVVRRESKLHNFKGSMIQQFIANKIIHRNPVRILSDRNHKNSKHENAKYIDSLLFL